jgi:hypothetical protein
MGTETEHKAEQFLKYIGTHVDEFHAKRKRVLHLLGEIAGAMPPSGYYHEELLRGFLRAALPGLCSVNHGYIYGFGLGNSRQIDVLIWDAINYAPIFKEGDLCIVAPESVIATIEVSSTGMPNRKLREDLEKLDTIADIENVFRDSLSSGENSTCPIVKAIVYFTGKVSPEQLQKSLSQHYHLWPDEKKKRLEADLRKDEEEIREFRRATFNWFRHLVQGVYCFSEKDEPHELALEVAGPPNGFSPNGLEPYSYLTETGTRNNLARLLGNIYWALSTRNLGKRGWAHEAALLGIEPLTGWAANDISGFDKQSARPLLESWK